MGRPKEFDVILKVKITKTQDAMLDMVSETLGVSKSRVVREMLDVELASDYVKQKTVEMVMAGDTKAVERLARRQSYPGGRVAARLADEDE